MATQNNLQMYSFLANADLSDKQYHFVKLVNASGTARIATAGAGEFAIGVLQNKPESGEVGAVATGGIVKVKAGGTITAGAQITSDASGQAVAATAGDFVTGIVLNTAASGDVVEVLPTIGGAVFGATTA